MAEDIPVTGRVRLYCLWGREIRAVASQRPLYNTSAIELSATVCSYGGSLLVFTGQDALPSGVQLL